MPADRIRYLALRLLAAKFGPKRFGSSSHAAKILKEWKIQNYCLNAFPTQAKDRFHSFIFELVPSVFRERSTEPRQFFAQTLSFTKM